MNYKDNNEALFWAYLENKASEEEREELELRLNTDPSLKLEFEETKALWSFLENDDISVPSESLQTSFDALLFQYKTQQKRDASVKESNYLQHIVLKVFGYRWASPLLFSLLGLALGFILFNEKSTALSSDTAEVTRLSQEVTDLKEMMMLAMLENPKASQRMKAVGYTKELNNVNDDVVDALMTTFLNDVNDNVRLAALKALTSLARDSGELREQLITALMNERSPLIQVALADVMINLQEKQSLDALKKRLKENQLDVSVKQKFEKTIKLLQT